MKGPVKPCEGRFSDELQLTLTRNKDRSQWALHPCEVCGLMVGARQDRGKWVPEQHWPTVKYLSSKAAGKTPPAAADPLAVPDGI